MPNAPVIEKNTELRALPSQQLGGQLRPISDPFNPAAFKAAENLGNAAEGAVELVKKRADETALMEAETMMNQWEAENLFSEKGAYAKRGKDAFDLPRIYGTQFDNDMTAYRENLGSNEQKDAFDRMVLSRRGTLTRTLYEQERREMETYRKGAAEANLNSQANRAVLFSDRPEIVEQARTAGREVITARGNELGKSPEEIANDMMEFDSKLNLSMLTRMADTNPKGAIDFYEKNITSFTGSDLLSAQKLIAPTQRKYKAQKLALDAVSDSTPRVARDDVIDFVLYDLEGGDKLVKDNNGADAKFGINAAAHPDLDVPTLTEEKAREVALERYWKKFDIESLPADMRLPVMAFAFTNEREVPRLLKEANNDPRKFNELAGEFYASLARNNPEKFGASLQGWQNRLAKVNAQIDAIHGELPSEVELYKRIDSSTDDPEVAEDAKQLTSKYLKQVEDARKEDQRKASEEAASYIDRGLAVPASVEARMTPEKAREMRKPQFDFSEYERVRKQVSMGFPVDLEEYRWRFGPGRFQELSEMQRTPAKQVEARMIDDEVESAAKKIIGKSEPKTAADHEKLETFRSTFKRTVDERKAATGKSALDEKEIQAIKDSLVLKPSKGFFSDDQYENPALTRDAFYFVNGVQTNYETMIAEIMRQLQRTGRPVNDANIGSMFSTLEKKGIIKKAMPDQFVR